MKPTRGERRAFICYALVLIGFLPPVTIWAAEKNSLILGLPFLLFWSTLMVLLTSILISLAALIKNRSDK